MMAKQKKLSPKYQSWIDARTRFHLSDMHIQMARELGMNPKKFGKLANHKQEPRKEPLPDFIESLYRKRFKKDRPEDASSIERMVKEKKQKQAERKARKQQEQDRQQSNSGDSERPADVPF
jgi:hypothetical protein